MLTEIFDPTMLAGIIIALGCVLACWVIALSIDIANKVTRCEWCRKHIYSGESSMVVNDHTYCSVKCLRLDNQLEEEA